MTPAIVKVMILRTAGTNCDRETAHAFEVFGARPVFVHVNHLLDGSADLRNYHILAIPGGFTYGDDIESGRILANELRLKLGGALNDFIGDKKLIIGICNGFQVLVKAGILPGLKSGAGAHSVTLTSNDSGKFEDRWIHLQPWGHSVWIKGLDPIVYLPVAHAEGKFVAGAAALQELNAGGQVAFRYVSAAGRLPVYPENPNGSNQHIAGITDPTGRVLGLMPHPERHFYRTHHPFWTRLPGKDIYGLGARIFKNGVEYVKENLL